MPGSWTREALNAVVGALQVIQHTERFYRADVDRCLEELQILLAEDTSSPEHIAEVQFWSRAGIRAYFAFVEAQMWVMRQVVLRAHEYGHVRLTPAERALLEEKTYVLNDKGVATERRQMLKLLPALRFSLELFARVARGRFRVEVEDEGWQALRRLQRVRDNLMHPKRLPDFRVTPDTLRDLKVASTWFSDQVTSLYQSILQGVQGSEAGGVQA